MTETSRKELSYASGELSFGQNLVYFPPNQKMYYILNNGGVYEVTLNRSDFSKTTIVLMNGITGNPPSTPVNSIDTDA